MDTLRLKIVSANEIDRKNAWKNQFSLDIDVKINDVILRYVVSIILISTKVY